MRARFLLSIFVLAFILFAIAAGLNSVLFPFEDEYQIPFLLLLAISAGIEEVVKFVPLRNAGFRKGLVLVLALATIESLFYALFAERDAIFRGVSTAMIWGVWFWLTLLRRFAFNGHVMFYLLATAIGAAERQLPRLRRAGSNYGVVGLAVAIAMHFLWNATALQLIPWPTWEILAVILEVVALASLYLHGVFDDLKEIRK